MSQADFTSPSSGTVAPTAFVPAFSGNVKSERRFTVEEYHRMADSGVLRPDERVELLRGIVHMMSPIGAPPSTSVELIYRQFLKLLPAGFDVSSQRDILFADSVPQPDVCVLRGSIRDYAVQKPRASDLVLVIEVAETTLVEDRGVKSNLYAEAGIPEYWIVNLVDKTLEVHRRPVAATGEQAARYEAVESFGIEASVAVTIDASQVGSIAVRDILP